MGMTMRELADKWRQAKIGLNAAAADVLMENGQQIVELSRQQLFRDGLDGDGNPLPNYKNPRYAKYKNQQNPLPGYGRPDLKLHGSFYDAYGLQADQTSMIIGSADQKAIWLVKRYGLAIYKLNANSIGTVRRNYLQPGLVQFLSRTTGAQAT